VDAVGWATIIGTGAAIVIGVPTLYFTMRGGPGDGGAISDVSGSGATVSAGKVEAAPGGFAMGHNGQISVGTASPPVDVPTPADGRGGRGGSGTIIGGSGEIVGGRGGEGGAPNGGRGGDGGGGTVVGPGPVRIIGGAGGGAGQYDGRGGRAAPGGSEVNNGPTMFWKYGRGAIGGNATEYNRRLAILTMIRQEYFREFPDETQFINAGVEQVPVNWVNKRLEELGETWRVELQDGGYKMPPLASPPITGPDASPTAATRPAAK
jgi:hypothetical protein